jgi:DHA2 family multidrug resistance protein-like MFS transporter
VLEFFWWGAAFLVAVPVMAVLLILGPRILPEYKDPNAGRLDIPSAAMSLLTVLAVIYALKLFAQDGFGWIPVASIALGATIAGLFVRRQRRLADPLIDLALFRTPGFSASMVVYAVGIMLVFGGFLFIPQYLQLVLGLSPLEAGLWTLPWAMAFVVGSQLTPPIARRFPPATVMSSGLAFAALGFAVFTQLDTTSGFAMIATGSVVFSLGSAPLFTLTNDLIIGSAPAEHAGAAAGLSETGAELGGALGIALFGSIGLAFYRAGVVDGIPAGLPPESATAATDTLGGAVSVAQGLPSDAAASLLGAADQAFLQGVHVSAVISAIGALALAAFTATFIGRAGTGPEPEGSAEPAEPKETREAA